MKKILSVALVFALLLSFALVTLAEMVEGTNADPTDEPTVETSAAPVTQPPAEPTGAPNTEPTTEPTGAPSTEPPAEPTGVTSTETATLPTTEPTTEPRQDLNSSSANDPTVPDGWDKGNTNYYPDAGLGDGSSNTAGSDTMGNLADLVNGSPSGGSTNSSGSGDLADITNGNNTDIDNVENGSGSDNGDNIAGNTNGNNTDIYNAENGSGNSNGTTGTDDSTPAAYTITIPASISLNDGNSLTVTASDVQNLDGRTITVTASSESGGKLKSGANEIGYTFTPTLTFTENGSQNVNLTLGATAGKPAGTYTDTLHFTVTLHDLEQSE